MTRIPFRAVLISLIALVAISGFVSTKKSTSSAEIYSFSTGACQDQGTTLVIDFGSASNKETITRCIRGFSGTGWELFKAAGLKVTGTNEYPESFVCRIDGFPGSSEEDCRGTPNTINGSWTYFYATTKTREMTWQRSPVGAAGRKPACGESEGWLFVRQDNNRPSSEYSFAAKPKVFSCN